MSWNELDELNDLKKILDDNLVTQAGFEKINVIVDLDTKFDISDINGDSTPVINIELDSTSATSSGAKGGMINGTVALKILVIVSKNGRKYSEYYGELLKINQAIRTTFDAWVQKRIQFVSAEYWNYYDVGGFPAVAVNNTYNIPIGNYSYL